LKKRKLKNSYLIPGFFVAAFFMACSDRPSPVLSEKKMEKVLFDLYLAEAEVTSNYAIFASDSALKQDLLNSVLKKHKITEAVLDSSLVWYNGNLDKYLRINDRVNVRYTKMLAELRPKPEENQPESGNIYLPVKEKYFFLTVKDIPQKVYTFKADTILGNYGGNYNLEFAVLGITPEIHPVVTFTVRCADSTYVKADTISQNGLFTSSIIVQQKQVRELCGSFYFPEIQNNMLIFVNNFKLFQNQNLSPLKK
jgi:hypothetical protein